MFIRFHFCLLFLLILLAPAYANTHHPQDFLKSIRGKKNEGEQIYNHFCVNCHAKKPVIPLGAPRKGEQNDWEIRLKQDFALLFKHSDEGFNAMPPRGGCFECSDEQLILAIIEMVPDKSKKVIFKQLLDHKKYSK
jgi:cytochrome c5